MSDCDVGESFLNFMLEPLLRPHAGIDLTPSFPEELTLENPVVQGCWQRMMMGLSLCPCFTTKDMLVVDKIIRKNRKCITNIFGWIKLF